MADFLPTYAQAELDFPGPLAKGARAKAGVRRLQEWCTLQQCGTAIDGDFGSGTEQALKIFQARNYFPATGVLDDATWRALTKPMRQVLENNVAKAGETLNDVVVRTAQRHLAVHPVEAGGQNRGPWVRLYMQGSDGEDQLWCAGFCCTILSQAFAALGGSGSPIPFRKGVDKLVADAKKDARFIPETPIPSTLVKPGSLFVKRPKKTKTANWVHTGIVIGTFSGGFQTVEGNSNGGDPTSNNGFEVSSQARNTDHKDFVLLSQPPAGPTV